MNTNLIKNRKKPLCNILFLLVVTFFMKNSFSDQGFMISDHENNKLAFSYMISDLAHYDVLLLGEWHGNPEAIKFQFNIIKALIDKKQRISLSLEHIETGKQSIINRYISNDIDAETFIHSSEIWESYMPIIDVAKNNNISIIASNSPKNISACVNRYGKNYLNKPNGLFDKSYLTELFPINAKYKSLFLNKIRGHKINSNINNLFLSQVVKDYAMAKSINLKDKDVGELIIHISGRTHVEGGLGIKYYLNRMNPALKVATLIPVSGNRPILGSGENNYRLHLKNESSIINHARNKNEVICGMTS